MLFIHLSLHLKVLWANGYLTLRELSRLREYEQMVCFYSHQNKKSFYFFYFIVMLSYNYQPAFNENDIFLIAFIYVWASGFSGLCIKRFFLLFLSNGFSLKYRLILRSLVRHTYEYMGMNIRIQFKVYLLNYSVLIWE